MSAESAAPIARPARLSEIAAERLREQILRGHLQPGAPLSQESLARDFGISRTPLRDALKTLEQDGLIQLDPTGAASVVDIDADGARDLLVIREVIDAVAARRAASLPAGSRRELGSLLEPILQELHASALAEDRYRFRVADSSFHTAILRHCGLEQLDRCHAFVHTTALSMYSARAPSPGHLATASEQHLGISEAVIHGNVDISARLAQEHVRHAYEYYYQEHADAASRH
jgi:GntR family transcriptional regulator, gluconate operon transcriptional repressor